MDIGEYFEFRGIFPAFLNFAANFETAITHCSLGLSLRSCDRRNGRDEGNTPRVISSARKISL